jgi:hypothetical protein
MPRPGPPPAGREPKRQHPLPETPVSRDSSPGSSQGKDVHGKPDALVPPRRTRPSAAAKRNSGTRRKARPPRFRQRESLSITPSRTVVGEKIGYAVS